MAEGKIKSKQLEGDISLDKLSGEGQLILASSSQIQITGTATSPNDLITKKELDSFTGGGGGTPLTIQDYNTGLSYSNISTIVFRGETVTIPTGGGTATGALATSNGANSVLVWIPAPTYVDYLTLTTVGGTSRYIASPTSEGTPYNIGAFSTSSAVTVVNSNMVYNVNEFGYFDDTATFDLNIYDFDGTTSVDSVSFSMSEIASGGSTVSPNGGITFNMLSKDTDQDRRKADIRITIDPDAVKPNGGRLTNSFIFTNSEGGGAGDETLTETYFYDSENTTADIDIPNGGTVSIEENTPTLKYVSGVAYYDEDSTFTFSVTEIDNLNDRSYPLGSSNQISSQSTSHQLRVLPSSNFGMSSTQTKWVANTDFTGWSTLYNVQSLAYYGVSQIDQSGEVTPGLNADNTLNTSNYPSINAVLFDWSTHDSTNSPDYPALIDTVTDISDDVTETFVTEARRLTVQDLLNGSEVTFDSQEDISVSSGTYSYELQQIFGHLVFPKINFSSIYPQYNITNTINYSGSGTSSVTLTVVNNITSLTTTSVSHHDFRWYVRKFSTGSALTTRGNGKWVFTTDFAESDLLLQNDSTAGNGNLLLYMALTNNTVPTQWYDLSKFSSSSPIQGPRANATGGGSSNLDSNGTIEWNTGGTQGWTAYLLVGIKNTSHAKEIENIELNDTDNSDWG
jgi:hypothetical protein